MKSEKEQSRRGKEGKKNEEKRGRRRKGPNISRRDTHLVESKQDVKEINENLRS